ncbi:MAG: hypothetical protein QXR42_08480 [Candidatus Bathyarchaeia archaeon]
MKPEQLKQEPVGSNGRLVEVKLFYDGAYYFVYETGIIFKLTKDDLRTDELETRKIQNTVEL